MIDLYTWNTPNGRKLSILLEELGVGHRVFPINITKKEQFSPDFLAISPNNKIPALVDREHDIKLMESGAIMIYLADKYGQFLPKEGSDRYWVLEWLMWQMGGLGPMAGQTHHFVHFNPGLSDYAEKRFFTETKRLYGVLNTQLEDTGCFVAGDYSIADMAAWPWVARYQWQGIDLSEFPHVARWYKEILQRPAVQRGYHVPDRLGDIPSGD